MTVVSISQMYAGHAAQVMALAAQCTAGAYFGKYVIVVDDDIDPTNTGQVLWAMATRSRPAHSIDILRETWSTFLDPSLNPPEIRPWGSKALINACMDYKHIKSFSPRTKLDKKTYETWCRAGASSASRESRQRSRCSKRSPARKASPSAVNLEFLSLLAASSFRKLQIQNRTRILKVASLLSGAKIMFPREWSMLRRKKNPPEWPAGD